jgi:S-adenosyl-L-methionine hydrolase (adenosine-forming)
VPAVAPITFLSDYGSADEFVGICHGVIARRCPTAQVIDITHGIPRHDVQTGALVLRGALAYMPAGVHLAVVDPGVGTGGPRGRRAVALRTADGDQLLVGPDNGLLSLAAERLGGVLEAFDVGNSAVRLEPLSRSFHGRDIFAPVAAALAAGERPASLGDPIAVDQLCRLTLPRAEVSHGALRAHVLRADTFGNLILDASAEQLAAAGVSPGATLTVSAGGTVRAARHASTFAEVPPGELLLYEDALQMATLAVNRGSAADQLGIGPGQELVVRRV